jgi:hypothetical protein
MKRLSAIAAAAAAAACQGPGDAPPEAAGEPQSAPAACAVQVEFGSYAMGIDSGTLERVERLLGGDRRVSGVTRTPWGREGEVTLCAALRSAPDAEAIAREIAALFPPDPRGPLAVRTAGGLVLRAGR